MVAYLAALPTYLAAHWPLRTGWEEAACTAYRDGIQGTMSAADALSRASGAVLTAFFSVSLQGWQMATQGTWKTAFTPAIAKKASALSAHTPRSNTRW